MINASLILIGIFFIFLFTFFVALIILYIVGRWKLFQKAGKNGWEAIIPLYNDWIYVEIAELNWWWYLLIIASTIGVFLSDKIPIAGYTTIISFLGLFVCNYNISKKLNQNTILAVLMTLFPFVMIPLIGLSNNYKWDNSVEVSNNGPFDNTNNKSININKNTEIKYCPNCGFELDKESKYCSKCGKEQ